MISVQEAAARIGSQAGAARVSRVGLAEAVGGILREPVYADRDFPPFHRATMDGIAVALAALQSGPRPFPVAGTAYAGTPPLRLPCPDDCL